MENALWNGKLYHATEIANNYSLEKEIRKASGRKELYCPDPECDHKILRYCHGEIKEAFFAHLNNESCDYANFDKENTQTMRTVWRLIYDKFKSKGYNVQPEVKLLAHHYTHLYFEMENGDKIAVEIGTQHLSANRIDFLTEQYKNKGIFAKWIVLGSTHMPICESKTFFLKRYLLNESTNKDLIVVNWDGSEVAQFKVDPNKYEYNGQIIHSDNYSKVYSEYSTIDSLILDNNELTFDGFEERYLKWLHNKKKAFSKKIIALEEERKHTEELNRKEQERHRLYIEQQRMQQKSIRYVSSSSGNIATTNKTANANNTATYEQRRQEILPRMSQQTEQVRDSSGNRWIKCEICGLIDTDDKFVSYGGTAHINLGTCYNCSRKK